MPNLLIVDDDKFFREETTKYFSEFEGWSVTAAATGEECLIRIGPQFDAVVLDLKLSGSSKGIDGEQVLTQIRQQAALDGVCVVIVTAHGGIDCANRTLARRQAYWYQQKPVKLKELKGILVDGIIAQKAVVQNRLTWASIIGDSRPMREVLAKVEKVAGTESAVLLRGETGTGKGLIAKAIHGMGSRRNKPFVVVHGSGIRAEMMNSTLFGHRRGAFTGATESQLGLFQSANSGTLFIDDVDNLSLEVQAGCLRAVDDKKIRRLGDHDEMTVDVRLIASTNKDLRARSADGRFMEDLMYRLDVFSLVLPPLRSRVEDIEPLSRHFLEIHRRAVKKTVPDITPDAVLKLQGYAWPGNVRELSNVIERAVILAEDGDALTPDMLTLGDTRNSAPESMEMLPWNEAQERFKKQYFTNLFKLTKGNVRQMAQLAKVHKSTIYLSMDGFELPELDELERT